jgi:hypothetical protein
MNNMDKFWMVYRDCSNHTSKKHATKEEAIAEAKQLADIIIGSKFYVFQLVAVCEAEKPQVMVTELAQCNDCRFRKGDWCYRKFRNAPLMGVCVHSERMECEND